MPALELAVAGGASLDVRSFAVREAISMPFVISVTARCEDGSLPLEKIVGHPASFHIVSGLAHGNQNVRTWKGICRFVELEAAIAEGLSTYRFEIVPELWLLTQRRDYRIFQHATAQAIAKLVLAPYQVATETSLDATLHASLPYKVQYAESDYAFFCRILEEAGIAFYYPDNGTTAAQLTLADALDAGDARGVPIAYVDNPNEAAEEEFLSGVRFHDDLRPGAYTLRDYDLRRPNFALVAEARKASSPEDRLEQYDYRPGAFLIDTAKADEGTPVADREAPARHEVTEGGRRAQAALDAERSSKRGISFRTNTVDLWPGRVFTMTGHPHSALSDTTRLLVTELSLEGGPGIEWTILGRAVLTSTPYRPPIRTPRPHARVQSAMVKAGSVDADEFGRVRVQFPWDRDAGGSCWVRVNQGWAGTGYGMLILPRSGQEVLVDFLDGDPEQPVIVGRVFNQTQAVPHRLPEHDTRSAWESDSCPGSGGFNQIVYEDKKGEEFLSVQAQKDGRRLVKHDDTSTIVGNRQKEVQKNELETTGGNRVQVTDGARVEQTDDDGTRAIEGVWRERVSGKSMERLESEQCAAVGKDRHIVVGRTKCEMVEWHGHLRIGGARQESVGATSSLSVGKVYGEAVGSYSVMATGPTGTIHLIAGSGIVVESPADVTVQGAGGFIKVDGGGVTILGTEVVINDGGSPGSLPGPSAKLPKLPSEAFPNPPREEEQALIEIVDEHGTAVPSGQTWIVGQRVSLTVRSKPTGKVVTNIEWVVPGETISRQSFALTKGSSTPTTPNDWHRATVQFHWAGPPPQSTITVTGVVSGKASVASVSIRVLAPTGVSLTSKTKTVNIDTDEDGGPALIFSDLQLKTLGIAFQGALTAPSDGEVAYLQLIKAFRSHTTTAGSLPKKIDSGNDYWNDDSRQVKAQEGVFMSLTLPTTAGSPTQLMGGDAPNNPLGKKDTTSIANDSFKLYLMYRPNLPNAIWVTVARLLWWWKGTAQKTSGVWSLVPDPDDHSIDPVGSPSSELPEWKDHFLGHQKQW